MDQVHNKILFIGPMGAGKTTAINTLSDQEAVSTEARNSNRELYDKANTTVAMDYGFIELEDGQPVHLYGIPGQRHFEPVWPIVAKGAIGALLLANVSQPDWQSELLYFVNAFADLSSSGRMVVALNRCQPADVQETLAWLTEQGVCLAVLEADPRNREQLLLSLEILIANLEIESQMNG
jgi:uncharacterized protein